MEAPTLGRRGQGWVWLQFALMAAVFAAGVLPPDWPVEAARALDVSGAALALAGAALAVWAGRALGRALTPYPEPAAGGDLAAGGPYRVVRHPIYAAGILFLGGYALVTGPLALVPLAVLAPVWALKASVEERYLRARYDGYADYARRVRWRLVPGVY